MSTSTSELDTLKAKVRVLSKSLSEMEEWSQRRNAKSAYLRSAEFKDYKRLDDQIKSLPEYLLRTDLRSQIRALEKEADSSDEELSK